MSAPLPVTGAVFVRDPAHRHVATVRSMLLAGVPRVVVGAADPANVAEVLVDDRVEVVEAHHVGAFVSMVSHRHRSAVLACDEPVLLPRAGCTPMLAEVAADIRVATVVPWCNFAGYLSFPYRNQPTSHQLGDLDEHIATERLRERGPREPAAAVPLARGPLVLVARAAVTACGDLVDTPWNDLSVSVAEFGLRAVRRGLVNLVDPSTFVVRPFDLALPTPDVLERPEVREWLHARHPVFPAQYDRERFDDESPIGQVHAAAAAKARGLSVAIDGSCLGALETGTQVHITHLVGALAARADVREITVSMPGPVPAYARSAFADPKVVPVVADDGVFPPDLRVDVVHRPFQPDRPLPWDHWRTAGRRVCVTLQDLIAYRVGAYHSTPEQWIDYRRHYRHAAAHADAVVVFADDVARSLAAERLPVPADRVAVMPCGTDHLTGAEEAVPPAPFAAPDRAAARFVVTLGTTYAHKNRDLAVRAWRELRARGYDHELVLVGAHVPYGSSRAAESTALGVDDDGVVTLLDVTSAERNWLLRHADAVLYPTGAEGFGLVPFEAARFGTPTVSVGFGPLTETNPDGEEWAASWAPGDLADAVQRLLDDPARAAEVVRHTLRAGDRCTWADAAEKLVGVYRAALAWPVRSTR